MEENRPLAVVYGGGLLGEELIALLRKKDLRVISVDLEGAPLPALAKPSYIIFFAAERMSPAQLKQDWREAVVTAKRNEARLLLCLENLSAGMEQRLMDEAKRENWDVRLAEVKGAFDSKEEAELAAGKLVREIFSSGERTGKLLLVGREARGVVPKRKDFATELEKIVAEKIVINHDETPPRKKSKNGWWVTAISLAVIIFFLPFLLATILAGWGAGQLRSGEKLLVAGKFDDSGAVASQAESKFGLAANIIIQWSMVSSRVGLGQATNHYYDFLLMGKGVASGLFHAAAVAKVASETIAGVMGEAGSTLDLNARLSAMKPDLAAIDQDLGLIEAQWPAVLNLASEIGPWFGLSTQKINQIPADLSQARELVAKVNGFLDVLPEMVGRKGTAKKNYLVVLQNSTELRPTGGFIGSYAVVSFDSGRLLSFKINDIYSADGQLRGRIQPPDEILHYLGQPSWFMRDANWAADWPLSAKRLEWFLEKETGEKVAGVWAVSLPAVQKMLAATGPLALPDLNQTVSAADFYHKVQYTAEINFFPGSTQKRDFLGATTQALLEKITSDREKDWIGLGKALGQALTEKDIMLYFDDNHIQRAVETANWGGSILANGCGEKGANCLMVIEANVGANKANFFLSRSITVNSLIGKGGEVENRVTVRYQNNSPSVSWPGGTYKNYLRFLVPVDADLVSFDIGDGRRAKLSDILTADVLSKVAADQFLVFKSRELTGESQGASDSGLLSFGTYFEIPVGESRLVNFVYRPNYRVNFKLPRPELAWRFLKQPGTGADPLEWMVDYPSFLKPIEGHWSNEAKVLVLPQKLDYNTELNKDREIKVEFNRD